MVCTMEMVLNQKEQVIAALDKHGGVLPPAPTGPIVEAFDTASLAAAIDSEIERSKLYGWTKLSLHFDLPDAAEFARWLRRSDRVI